MGSWRVLVTKKAKKVLVTGSRDFEDGQMVLDALTAEQAESERMIVIHGGAKGADSIAGIAGTYMPGVLVASVPADWTNDGKSAAGPIRNAAMLDLEPDVVLAFYKTGAANRGTQNCVDQATGRGIEVKVFSS